MLSQPCIPEITSVGYDVLIFFYIGFNLLGIFASLFLSDISLYFLLLSLPLPCRLQLHVYQTD